MEILPLQVVDRRDFLGLEVAHFLNVARHFFQSDGLGGQPSTMPAHNLKGLVADQQDDKRIDDPLLFDRGSKAVEVLLPESYGTVLFPRLQAFDRDHGLLIMLFRHTASPFRIAPLG